MLVAGLAPGRCTVIVAIVASGITGITVGWVAALITASAAMSHSQQRMQRRVRYWQAEASFARAQAETARTALSAMTQGNLPPWPVSNER